MPDPITPEQIAADREIIGKATPGQWQTCGVRARIDGQPYLAVIGPKGVIAYIPYSDRTDADHVQAHVDEKIIVGSHERWPAYVDGYERLVKENEKLRTDLKVSEKCTRIAREVGSENLHKSDQERSRWATFNHDGQPLYGIARLALDRGDTEKAKEFFDRFDGVWDFAGGK